MKTKHLAKLGVPRGQSLKKAQRAFGRMMNAGFSKQEFIDVLQECLAEPEDYLEDKNLKELAASLLKKNGSSHRVVQNFVERDQPAPWQQWGSDLEEGAVHQMKNAARLPISVRGALMPDAHLGYGLPIGGVLATVNAVIPYAVGMDIACRMKMSVLDVPLADLDKKQERFTKALDRECLFGVGAAFRDKHKHKVMDEDWSFSAVTSQWKNKAWGQLGTSGAGNHFVEFGSLTLDKSDLGLPAGKYLALLSHSGSRGTGAQVATHYSKVARQVHPELPKELGHLAWFDLDSEEGQEYWQAMELMGRYAAANHELIHKFVIQNLGARVLADIENHHNYAWREKHQGKKVVVHRKGATPAGTGALGIIPGSMGTPGYVVRGKGNPMSLDSAAHGAGRLMSRKQAKKKFNWNDAMKLLESRGVKVITAGLDEVPMAYKDIERVMQDQDDLVERVARFDPKLVKMSPG
jgi:tRNA-splicing ligase RtcB